MSDGDRLLAYCNSYPDDDLAHRAYADWLEETGDPVRAEFVRLQLDRSQLWDGHPDDEDLWDRDRVLQLAHGAHWRAELPPAVRDSASFSRGLLTQFDLTGEELLSVAPEKRGFTLLGLRLRATPGEMAAIIKGGYLRGVRSLSLLNPLEVEQAVELAGGEDLAEVRSLALLGMSDAAGALAALLTAPALRSLRELLVPHAPPGLAGILSLPDVPFRLRRFRLQYGQAPLDVRALRLAPCCADLEQLSLDGEFSVGAGQARAAKTPFSRLSQLLIATRRLAPAQLVRCLDFIQPGQLEQLNLGGVSVPGTDLFEVLNSLQLVRLTDLQLSLTGEGDEGWVTLCSARLPSLRFLRVATQGLTRLGLQALSRAPLLGQLRQLSLSGGKEVSVDGFRELLENPALEQLEELSCYGMGICHRVVEMIARSPFLRNLRVLSLGNNGITMEGARALASAGNFPALCRLDLSNCSIGPEGAAALLDSPLLDGIVRLDVAFNGVGLELREVFRRRANGRPWQV